MLQLLLVEDQPADARLVQLYLEESMPGIHTSTWVTTRKDGLAQLSTKSFDIVLLDLSLPDSFGQETLQSFLQYVPQVPIILLTGNDDQHLGKQFIQSGAQDYLVKGNFDSAQLQKAIDFTIERIRYQKEIQSARLEVAERMKTQALMEAAAEIREQFLTRVSHEMRTPLHSLITLLYTLHDTPVNAQQKALLGHMSAASEILLKMINDVLDLGKMKTNHFSLEQKPFSLRSMLQQVERILLPGAQSKGITLDLDVDKSLQDIWIGDAIRLQQILLNLGQNAIKFTNQGGVRLIAEQIQNSGKETLRFQVQDSGLGITQDEQERIFEPFHRMTRDQHVTEGTGLGLAIARQLAEIMGGGVYLKHSSSNGSIFEVQVQCTPGNKFDISQEKKLEIPEKYRAQSFSILLAEDHPVNQMVTRNLLVAYWKHARIHVASDGKEADQLLKEHAYDIVLMDEHMPYHNGTEVVQRYRLEQRHPGHRISFIAVTANEPEAQKFSNGIFDDVLIKPFSPEAMHAIIYKNLHTDPS